MPKSSSPREHRLFCLNCRESDCKTEARTLFLIPQNLAPQSHSYTTQVPRCKRPSSCIMLCTLLLSFLTLLVRTKCLPKSADVVTHRYNAMPVVDLGCARYGPTAVNVIGQFYNFSNIRYAAPPVGELRWRAPQDPPADPLNGNVDDGSVGYICPQAEPLWFTQANRAVGNLSAVLAPGLSSQEEREDGLFLDVIVPITVYRQRKRTGKLTPILCNIHGGGFFMGEKRALSPPLGLLRVGDNDFIYVSINYRVRMSLFFKSVAKLSKGSLVLLGFYPIWKPRLKMSQAPMPGCSVSISLSNRSKSISGSLVEILAR